MRSITDPAQEAYQETPSDVNKKNTIFSKFFRALHKILLSSPRPLNLAKEPRKKLKIPHG